MPAGTNLVSSISALGDLEGGFEEIVSGTLPASSPLTYTSKLASVRGVSFMPDLGSAPLAAPAYQVTGNAVTVHFDAASVSRAFTLRLVGKR